MELIKGLLALAVVLGVPFLVLCAIGFIIVCLIALIPGGDTDWMWSPDIYKGDKKKK